jgi:surface antigen
MRGRVVVGLAILAGCPFLTGCAGASKTAQGAGIGGAIGAGTGALIGKANNGKAGQGALVGGLIGAGVGGLIGNEHDRQDKAAMEERIRQAESSPPMGMDDVIQLTKDNTPEDVIISQIRSTGSTFQLTTEDVRTLNSSGVSPSVIKEMQYRRPGSHPRPRYGPPPGPVIVHPVQPVYVVPAPLPPPPGFGVGLHFRN